MKECNLQLINANRTEIIKRCKKKIYAKKRKEFIAKMYFNNNAKIETIITNDYLQYIAYHEFCNKIFNLL